MSDTNTSNEVGNLYTNYNGDVINPVFYALDINPEKIMGNEDSNPTSGCVIVTPREAGEIFSTDLMFGSVAIPVALITPEKEKIINERAEASGGIGKGKGGVVAFREKEEARNKNNEGREQDK